MTTQLTLPDPLPTPVLTAARKAMAAAGCPGLADDPARRQWIRIAMIEWVSDQTEKDDG